MRSFGSWSLALSLLVSASAHADSIWDYQAVNPSDGRGSHPLVGADPEPWNRVTIEGVALAGVDEILNPAVMYTIFVQDDRADLGGMQVWAGSWWYGGLWRPAEYVDFQAGDRVRITGLLGNHRGKVFINDRHSSSPQTRFVVEVIGHVGVPDPLLLPSISECNYFDWKRRGGGERYQTRFVMLHNVQITAGTWGNDQLLTIADATGSVDMLLSGRGDFASYSQPTGLLNVVGIFDQEDPSLPFFDNYRVWVKKYADIARALDTCDQALAAPVGTRLALVRKSVSQVTSGRFEVRDATGSLWVTSDRAVTVGDVVAIQGVKTSSNHIEPRYVAVLSAVGKVTLTGTVAVGHYVPGPARIPVTLWLYDLSAGEELVHTHHVLLDSNGSFSVDLQALESTGRQYRVRAKAPHWLAAEFFFTAGGDQTVSWQFVNGDLNGDNQVGLNDLNGVLLKIGREFSDLDGDGQVGLTDLNVVLVNFGRTGAP